MNPRMLVRSLKGSVAQVLLAFLFARRAMDEQEIEEWTGLGRETVGKAAKSLEGMGLIGRQVLANNRYLWLPGGDMLPLLSQAFQLSEKSTSEPPLVVDAESRSELPTITTTTLTISQLSEKSTTGNRTPDEQAELLAILKEYQIAGRKRADLLACEWVTAEYIRLHVEHAMREGKWDHPVGMAIIRMLDHEDAPAAGGHGENCPCAKCKVERFTNPNKYTTGKYGGFVNR